MKKTLNMTEGNILKLIIRFAVPLMISGVLQIMYSAADMMVVGRFSGDDALAAVGSSTPAINMLINVFLGLSSATNVIVARRIGKGDEKKVSDAVHTAMLTAVICGAVLMVSGVLLSGKIVNIMGVPQNIFKLSVTYLCIYFIGIPAMMIMNFGSAILQSSGDSMHPTAYVIFSGILNVILNFVFVAGFKMSVAGVALATIISQYVAAGLVIRCLIKTPNSYRLDVKKLRITKDELKETVYLGIPAGLQSTFISVSNVIVQTSVNKCGSVAMAGSAAANNIEGIIYIALYAFFQTAITFTSQNFGAGNIKRMKKGFIILLVTAGVFGVAFEGVILCFSPALLKLYTGSDIVISVAMKRLIIVCSGYFICGISDVANGALRGLGVIKKTILVYLLFECGTRIVMTYMGAPFKNVTDLVFIFYSFPVAWFLTGAIQICMFFYEIKKECNQVC